MSEHLRVETSYAGQPWRPLPSVTPNGPPGSVSTDPDHGEREVYLFGWVDGAAGVWRSVAGFDVEVADVRLIATLEGLEQVSDLAEPYEMDWRGLDRLRFTRVVAP